MQFVQNFYSLLSQRANAHIGQKTNAQTFATPSPAASSPAPFCLPLALCKFNRAIFMTRRAGEGVGDCAKMYLLKCEIYVVSKKEREERARER